MDASVSGKLDVLRAVLEECESVCIGYSGGVDSVFLARFALDVLGPGRMLAVTGISAAVPAAQYDVARSCADRFGIPHLEVTTDELADPNYAANPNNRCYYCKTELWRVLSEIARTRALRTLCDGTIADDVSDHRPGTRAGAEWRVRSPLLEAGLSKADVRAASRVYDLPTWDAPSSPCLASRLPYGLAVTADRLKQVEAAERIVRGAGFREFRVRHHDSCARLELAPGELDAGAGALLERLTREIAQLGFARVLIDVEGYRRGALNEVLPLIQLQAVR